MEDWFKCQISPLVKYRQNKKYIEVNCVPNCEIMETLMKRGPILPFQP